jgi:hypothetical protein
VTILQADDQEMRFLFFAGAENFSLLHGLQNCSVVYTTSGLIGVTEFFSGVK